LIFLNDCMILQLAIGHGDGSIDFYLIKRALGAGVTGPFMSHTPGHFLPLQQQPQHEDFSHDSCPHPVMCQI